MSEINEQELNRIINKLHKENVDDYKARICKLEEQVELIFQLFDAINEGRM